MLFPMTSAVTFWSAFLDGFTMGGLSDRLNIPGGPTRLLQASHERLIAPEKLEFMIDELATHTEFLGLTARGSPMYTRLFHDYKASLNVLLSHYTSLNPGQRKRLIQLVRPEFWPSMTEPAWDHAASETSEHVRRFS